MTLNFHLIHLFHDILTRIISNVAHIFIGSKPRLLTDTDRSAHRKVANFLDYAGSWLAYILLENCLGYADMIINNKIPSLIFTGEMCTFLRVNWRTKEMFYLTTHSTHFVYGYMASDIWYRTIQIARVNPLPPHRLFFPISTNGTFMCAIPDRIAHTTAFVTSSRGALAGTRNSLQRTEWTKHNRDNWHNVTITWSVWRCHSKSQQT